MVAIFVLVSMLLMLTDTEVLKYTYEKVAHNNTTHKEFAWQAIYR